MKLNNDTLRALEVLSQVIWAMVGSLAVMYSLASIPNAPVGVAVFYTAVFFVPIVIYLCYGLFSTAPPYLYVVIAICAFILRWIPTGLDVKITMIMQLLYMSTGTIACMDFIQSKRRYPILVYFISAVICVIGLAMITSLDNIDPLAVVLVIYMAGVGVIQAIWTMKGVLKWV